MNAVVFYSNTGESKTIASHFADKLGYPLLDILGAKEQYESLVLVFPIYAQSIPDEVKAFLKRVTVKHLSVIATYGKMCCGNALYEIKHRYEKNIVAGAYLPTKHSYIEEDTPFLDFDALDALVEKIRHPSSVTLPRLYKNPLASLFPNIRGRIGLKIQRTDACDGCNVCAASCPKGAIHAGRTDKRCVRCARCVHTCPKGALRIKLSLPLRLYLKRKKKNDIIIYV